MTNQYSIADARRNLPTIIREAENGKEVELTRRGEPVAMLISVKAIKLLKSTHGDFATAYRKFRKTANLFDLDLNPDELFSDVRDETAGREIHF